MRRIFVSTVAVLAMLLSSCERRTSAANEAAGPGRVVSVVKVTRKTLQQDLTVSSELVPFQQIDVYAKESGFVRKLNVDYGTRVRTGQVMAILEIPELQLRLTRTQAKLRRDEAVFNYSEITAPFSGEAVRKPRNIDAIRNEFQHPGFAANPTLSGRSVPACNSGSGIQRSLYHTGWSSRENRLKLQ